MVEDEEVRERGADEVDDEAKDPGQIVRGNSSQDEGEDSIPSDEIQSQCLSVDVVSRPCAHISPLRRFQLQVLTGCVIGRRHLPHAGEGGTGCSILEGVIRGCE